MEIAHSEIRTTLEHTIRVKVIIFARDVTSSTLTVNIGGTQSGGGVDKCRGGSRTQQHHAKYQLVVRDNV